MDNSILNNFDQVKKILNLKFRNDYINVFLVDNGSFLSNSIFTDDFKFPLKNYWEKIANIMLFGGFDCQFNKFDRINNKIVPETLAFDMMMLNDKISLYDVLLLIIFGSGKYNRNRVATIQEFMNTKSVFLTIAFRRDSCSNPEFLLVVNCNDITDISLVSLNRWGSCKFRYNAIYSGKEIKTTTDFCKYFASKNTAAGWHQNVNTTPDLDNNNLSSKQMLLYILMIAMCTKHENLPLIGRKTIFPHEPIGSLVLHGVKESARDVKIYGSFSVVEYVNC